ncbi:MAG TPA: hypothetical protein VMV56_09615, partial [Williamwhitmania sp.]|nr:hypothetical protein [Williamwhitmania sp.]
MPDRNLDINIGLNGANQAKQGFDGINLTVQELKTRLADLTIKQEQFLASLNLTDRTASNLAGYRNLKTQIQDVNLQLTKLKIVGEESTASLVKSEAGFHRFTGYIERWVARMGLFFAGMELYRFVENSVKSFGKFQAQVERLDTAVGGSSKALLSYAQQLQKTTAFADEDIVSVMAQIGAYTQNQEVIKQLTKATLDFAAGMASSGNGISLSAAGRLVAKTFGSSTDALSRYGIMIGKTSNQTERLNAITEGVSNLFGGQAAAQLDTYEGKMKNLHNELDDVRKELGSALAPALLDISEAITTFVKSDVEGGTTAFAGLGAALKIVAAAAIVAWTTLREVGTLIGTVGASIAEAMTGNWAGAGNVAILGGKSMIDDFKEAGDAITALIQKQTSLANLNPTGKKMMPGGNSNGDKKTAEEQLKTIKEYYNQVKFEDKDYFNFRKKEIDAEGTLIENSTHSAIKAKTYENEELKKLIKEQSDWELKQIQDKVNHEVLMTRISNVGEPNVAGSSFFSGTFSDLSTSG